MNLLKWLLLQRFKSSKKQQKPGGFTLLELLVALILAALVITPLLGFMVNIMLTDHQEQAKATSEQELKSALDFMTRDLQQAVYIYDADGINAIRSQLPKYSQKTQYFPVLVFWKRQFIPSGITVTGGSNDTFVYSLVAYYLIQDNNPLWSNAARIGRFQISNGYGSTTTAINSTRDPGFQLFNLQNSGTLKSKMDAWQAMSGESYTQDILPLIDYVDQTAINTTTNPAPTCSIGQMVPNYSGTSGDSVPTGSTITRGFYVCVDSTNTIAQIYLRGNALARLQNSNFNFNGGNKFYFPQFSRQVQGHGFVFTK
jgi:prepilin-type N-terminal cleavage/methylation domain-containing protein